MDTRNVYLYIFDTMSDWEYGYLIPELNSGRYFKKGLNPIEIKTIGSNMDAIYTMGGLKILPDISIEDCVFEKSDLLILPGGTTWNDEKQRKVLEKVKMTFNKGIIVAAICGAVDALANIGFLDSVSHTSNNLEFTKFISPNYKGENCFKYELVVSSKNVITASGIAPLEFAREVIEVLDVFESDTLNAWYALYKTHDQVEYYNLMNSIS